MGKLEDLRVERVDGVDRPATGHNWVIVKSADKDPATLAKTALEALVKEEGLTLAGETVEALKALAAALDIELDFAKAEEQDAPEADAVDEDVEKDAADEEVEKDEKPLTAEDVAGIVTKTVQDLFAAELDELDAADEEVEKDEDAPTTPLIVAKSKQPRHQDGESVEKSNGRVSYESIFDQ